ncbi:hypothetical protein ACJJID_06145 [Microbulbifer sp. CnH-101-G]|uniref:hypothetical protein n=1 Tax=unclassified Microbulbifer TaxID=2619833 RepID=UPI004039BE64
MAFLDWISGKRNKDKKNQAAYEKGQDFGGHLVSKVDEFSSARLDQITVNLLEVFKGRLETVCEDPEHDPKLVAAAELEIFKEQIGKAQENMWSELQQHLSSEIEIAEKIDMVEEVADLIETATEQRLQILIAGAKALYDSKVEEIESQKT